MKNAIGVRRSWSGMLPKLERYLLRFGAIFGVSLVQLRP